MSIERDIVVIGAGLTGLAAAHSLTEAGRDVLVIDKGRQHGGRMAHRERDGFGFDHGTPWVEAEEGGFADFLAKAERSGAAKRLAKAPSRVAGMPDMTALPGTLAVGVEIRQGVVVSGVERHGTRWKIDTSEGPVRARHLICAVPAPQAEALLPEIREALSEVTMEPGWTLMAAFEAPLGVDAPEWPDNGARVIREPAKPGRPEAPEAWTMHAPLNWARENLERDREEIVPDLLRMLGNAMGRRLPKPIHARAHRWRYSRTGRPLGHPFLKRDRLHVGGDWCLGPLAEDAYASGMAIAEDILGAVRGTDGVAAS